MMQELHHLLDRYVRWLRDKSVLRQLENGHIEITTPYLDRHNDYMQIYVRRDNGGFLLTDGGETIEDLRASGVDLDTPKRTRLLTTSLNAFGIRRQGDDLVVHTTTEKFPLHKHNLVQAILAVDNLFYLARPLVRELFHEDVASWLLESDVRFTQNAKFTGVSGYDHSFHFIIPPSRKAPERLIRAVNRPTRDMAESLAFAWIDIRDVRSKDTKFYAFLNDRERGLSSAISDALKNYGLIPVPWSERSKVRDELAA